MKQGILLMINVKNLKKLLFLQQLISLYKFNFKKKTSCYRCFMPEKPAIDNNCQSEGIFSPVAGILGTLQANEVLKTILGFKDSFNNHMMVFNSVESSFRKIKLSYNPNCKNKCLN